MNIITKVHRDFLFTLLKEGVEFMLIGGYAVIYHGYPRLTMDMDIWLKPDNKNKPKLLSSLQSYGIVKEDIDKVSDFDFSNAQSFYIGEESNKIDFLTCIAGVSYEEADAEKDFLEMGNKKIPIIDYKHLVVNKILTGRLQDKADVDMLQKIRRHSNKK